VRRTLTLTRQTPERMMNLNEAGLNDCPVKNLLPVHRIDLAGGRLVGLPTCFNRS